MSSIERPWWRSVDELADPAALDALVARELPWLDPIRRRSFLKLMGAALALGGFAGCSERPPAEPIVPYVRAPEGMIAGQPVYYATAMPSVGGLGLGLLVKSHLGRPLKVEGNPDHPASRGATDAFAQASVLTLYDPERLQAVTYGGAIRTWPDFLAAFRSALAVQRARRGGGLRILTETVTSPTLGTQLAGVLAAYPDALWHQWEPTAGDSIRAGALAAFGEDVRPIHHVDRADVVVALDADFLGCGPSHLVDVRRFAARRRPGQPMNRLYVAESGMTPTGAKADHRLRIRSADVAPLARALAAAVGVPGAVAPAAEQLPRRWLEAVVADLRAHRGRSLVLAGETQPAEVLALAHLANTALGNVGATVTYCAPAAVRSEEQLASLRALVADMAAGRVELLVVIGGDPAFTAPADLGFADAMAKVPLIVALGLHETDTTARAHWVVPAAHWLESWSDVRAYEGTASVVQPLIAPLYQGRSPHELLSVFADGAERAGHDLVREQWRATRPGGEVDDAWQSWLERGVIAGTAYAAKAVSARPAPAPSAPAAAGLEVVFRPDPMVHDGRFARNAWLQELPRPLSRLTWDSAVHVAPALAARLGTASGDVVEVAYRGRTIRGPVWIAPGQADESVTILFGYGGRGPFREHGYDGYALRPADALWSGIGVELRATGERQRLAQTQHHHSMEGRDIVRVVDGAGYHAETREPTPEESLYPQWKYDGYRWGMAIDLAACVGCQACVAACQAENNIPTVGRNEVLRGREMHWLRIDAYFSGDAAEPDAAFMPVPCMHCENAPCELVCPVEATVHDAEGLNQMVYNRCVGTRYCSNNCPYKVRRFNFFEYARWDVESLKLLHNPDVTVRSRGVMEKCTYCVQRITHARIDAEKEGRRIHDGEVVTACQQACPAEAIVFGDLNDPNSKVRRLKAEARNYALLEELNTQPRTTYLAALTNRKPDLA
ncbi:MAG TPA: Fe-S-cluster-containing hydrogenase [Candidatus Binatia bacterium]|nr:Fe-S-cluster-containing hydrogenase [Candidatus Binatia bacterium]